MHNNRHMQILGEKALESWQLGGSWQLRGARLTRPGLHHAAISVATEEPPDEGAGLELDTALQNVSSLHAHYMYEMYDAVVLLLRWMILAIQIVKNNQCVNEVGQIMLKLGDKL